METLARVEAARRGRAEPLATVRHRHLAERPLVLVPLTMAGEAAAPWAAMVGTDRAAPRLLLVPQPLDREQRFAFLAELAEAVLPHLEACAADTEPRERGRGVDAETVHLCTDAPQLVVPNRAGIGFLGLLGRSTRFRRSAPEDGPGAYRVPARVPLLGRWLTHYAERARTPGACLLVAATELLARHWATGQSGYEDLHLGSQLAWIDPPEGVSGAVAAERVETGRGADGLLRVPPAGPATDPAFDNRALAPALERYDAARRRAHQAADERDADKQAADELAAAGQAAGRRDADEDAAAERDAAVARLRELAEGQLRPVWDAVWRSLDLLRALPEAAHVAGRWEGDRWSFTGQRDRIAAGEAPQPKRDDAVTAARKLAARERAQAELAVQEALDDPLVMAERRLAGEAFRGVVESVEPGWSEGRSPRPRPVLTVRTADRPHLEPGGTVHRELAGRQQSAAVVGAGPAPGAAGAGAGAPAAGTGAGGGSHVVSLRLVNGMGRRKEPEEGTVPQPGETVVFTLFELSPRGGPKLPEPEDVPWTHQGAPVEEADAAEVWE